MESPTITVTINGSIFELNVADSDAIGRVPPAERQQLLELLEAIKQQNATVANDISPGHSDLDEGLVSNIRYDSNSVMGEQNSSTPERLGTGDADLLMARLIMEERANQKPGLTQRSMYKFIGGMAIVIILLLLLI